MVPDGGKRYTDTQYAWYNPDTSSYLFHTEANDEYADPFFEEEEDARNYLERLAEAGTKQEYENLSLHKLKSKKIGEAVEVLTDQAGLQDFAPDGGRPEDIHQISNPYPERVWFWYNPSADLILQEEVEPYDVRGVFESEEDAYSFIEWYADHYEVPDTTHLELYSADIELEGWGRKHAIEQELEGKTPAEEPPEQANFTEYVQRLGKGDEE